MVEPLTLATVGSIVLTEGVKFLYGQATAALKAWRARQQRRPDTAPPTQPPTPANILDGTLDTSRFDIERVAALESRLDSLRHAVSYWADGIEPVDINDRERLARVDELRRVLETLYGQRITFKGEARPTSGTPLIKGEADVDDVAGTVAGVQADVAPTGRVHGRVRAGRIEPGGQVFGVRIGGDQRAAGSPPPASKRSGTEPDEK